MSSKTPTTLEELYALVDECSGVIFDNDGTMVDTMPAHYAAYCEALKPHGISFPEKLFYELAGVPAADIIAQLSQAQSIPVSVPDVMAAKKAAFAKAMENVVPIEPTLAVLRYAMKKGLPVAIASGGERHDVVMSLDVSGVGTDVFGAMVTAENVKKGKPDPETFLLAAEKLGIDPAKCLGLEDGASGLVALKSAGMVAVDVRLIEGYPTPSYD